MAKAIWTLAKALARGDSDASENALRELYMVQNGICWWCEQEFKTNPKAPPFPPVKAALTRIVLNVPLTEDGKWWPSNLRLVCPPCALEKEERDRARSVGRRH